MKIINLTPHTVNICDELGAVAKSYPSKGNARVKTEMQERIAIDGVPVKSVSYSETEGLPPQSIPLQYDNAVPGYAMPDTFYIVSMVVAQANPGRVDLLCPNTAPGEVVRDASGQIIGVKSFARY